MLPILLQTEPDNPYTLMPTGIQFHGEISFEQWSALGRQLGNAGRSLGFMIGDWLNYGHGKGQFGETYHEAVKITGLDRVTLAMYARISRRVKFDTRVSNLSFEHHRKVAPLSQADQKHWLHIADKERGRQNGNPMSARRLAKSIAFGRVATLDEMSVPIEDRGIDALQVNVLRIQTHWLKLKERGFRNYADFDDYQNLIEDISPVVRMFFELKSGLAILAKETEEDI